MEGLDGGMPGNKANGTYCPRCSLFYPSEQSSCHHCKGLTAIEAKKYGDEFRKNVGAQNIPLVKRFIAITLVLALVVLVSYVFL